MSQGKEPNLGELTYLADELRKEVARLRLAVTQLKPRVERAERVSIRTAIASVIILILVVAVGFVGYRGLVTEQQVSFANARIDGICPVLALVVGGADPNSRAPGPDRDAYVQALQVMRKSYDDLNCTTPLVPPRNG
jgi:hypothetical protein